MEGGLGSTRMGSRSSTRHGPASVFQGRVRRWKKSWAPVAPSFTPSAASCRVLLYKWTPVTLPSNTNGTKESTPEEIPPAKPLRFLPVSVVLQQKKEEAVKTAEEAEVLAKLDQVAEPSTKPAAEAADDKQDTTMGGTQSEESGGAKVTESAEKGVEEAKQSEPVAASQNESTAAPQEAEAAAMDIDQSK